MSKTPPEISFVIYYPFQFYFYKDIYKALAPQAEFVIDLCHTFTSVEQQALSEAIVALLESIDAPYRIIKPLDYTLPGYLESFFKESRCLVSTWEKGCMTHESTRHLKKIRVAYGLGKELTMVRPSGTLYNLTLAHGPRDAANFSMLCPTEIVGLPKFDDWFSGRVGAVSNEVDQHLSKSKPTLLYLPTHGDLCSIEYVAPKLPELSRIYNVVVKMHYATARAEIARRQMVERCHCLVLDDTVDILPLLKCSDVVLSDNSSAIFEAMLADVPVVVNDFWSAEYLVGPHAEMRRSSGGAQAALSYPGSLEQVIKHDGSVMTCTDPKDLVQALAAGLEDTLQYRKRRREISDLFSFRDGRCGERAATAIRSALTDSVSRERPILSYVLSDSAYTRKSAMRTVPAVATVPGSSDVSALLLHIDDVAVSQSQRESSLLSVLTQITPKEALFQITIFTLRTKEVQSWIDEWRLRSPGLPCPKVLDGNSYALADAVRQLCGADAAFIGLTHASVRYDPAWLCSGIGMLRMFPKVGVVSAGWKGSSTASFSAFHAIPPGLLYSSLFRTKFMLGMTLNTFQAAAFEAGIKKHILTKAEWMLLDGLVVYDQPQVDWYLVGSSEALIKESFWVGMRSCMRHGGKWRELILYARGYLSHYW